MKEPNHAPCYIHLYPGLAKVAREHGYALAVHGSLARDFDLIAVPWTDEAVPAEQLIEALRADIGGFIIPNGTKGGKPDGQGGFTEAIIEQPSKKPHGRLAWNIHTAGAAAIDISVTPRLDSITKGD